ncbi:hypothetical protein BS50DRAFT_576838 [Corynespora cassiicola Philippines]|uniref:Uncharacterized protein n=1 Tax=Corynespora cassiicola Philippines TaxID=1448308 RepID=A0A2T2NCA0_CORCC|nr:hypothetical protein BS50DRAFT_576838 [Corynespora cassiicola Philippines]
MYSQQSPFFQRLPREIRDMIYLEYFFEQDGYICQPSSGKLTNSDGSPIQFDFMYTCRATAEEMKGLALQANIVTFRPSSTAVGENTDDNHGPMTISERFRHLLNYVALLKIETLYHAADCITEESMEQIEKAFPEAAIKLDRALHDVYHKRDSPEHHTFEAEYLGTSVHLDDRSSLRNAINFAFDLVSSHSRFESLASRILDSNTLRGPLRHLTDWDSFYEVLKWRPEAWDIPDELDISRIEGLVIWDIQFIYSEIPEHIENPYRFRYYFSAASIAIDFLKRYTSHRQNMRIIRIQEDKKFISHPWSHINGLVPFYAENSRLQIIWHVSLLHAILPCGVNTLAFLAEIESLSHAEDYMRNSHFLENVLVPLISWVEAAVSVPIPSNSFTLVLDNGSKDDTIWPVWNAIKHALMLYEILFKCAQLKNIDEALLTRKLSVQWPLTGLMPILSDEDDYTSGINFRMDYGAKEYTPSWLLANFVHVVKHMILRKSTRIKFSAATPLEPVWDIEGLMENIHAMSLREMREAWSHKISEQTTFPAEWVTDMCRAYLFNDHCLNRMLSARSSDVLT